MTCPPIAVEPELDSKSLEAVIVTRGRRVMTLAHRACWPALQAPAPTACPRGQHPTPVADGYRPYHPRTRILNDHVAA